MGQKTFRSLLAINILSGVLAFIVLLAGNVASDFRIPDIASTPEDFDERLAKRIGGQYTRDLHADVVDLVQRSDSNTSTTVSVLNSYGELGFPLGSILLVASAVGSIILLRSRSDKKTVE